jgi:hypothetical protein
MYCGGKNPHQLPITTMALSSKSMRELETVATESVFDFDFGEPEIISVEIAPGKFLSLQEPSADDLIEITKISDDKTLDEIPATLKVICILHSPERGGRKLTLKDARRLRSKQIKLLGNAINELLGTGSEADDSKSEADDSKSEPEDEDQL